MTFGVAQSVEKSEAPKLVGCAATYLTMASCSKACAFYPKPGGASACYGDRDHVGIWARRLDAAAGGRDSGMDPRAIARDEARAIDALSAARALRLHVVGDSRTNESTRIIARAAGRYIKRSVAYYRALLGLPGLAWAGHKVWSYCHTWRVVARASWGPVSILASCETAADVRAAWRRGYAAALVVAAHPQDGRAFTGPDGITRIPCPEQTRGIPCEKCRLCWRDKWLLRARKVITFAAHGGGKNAVKEALIQIEALQATRERAGQLMGIQKGKVN